MSAATAKCSSDAIVSRISSYAKPDGLRIEKGRSRPWRPVALRSHIPRLRGYIRTMPRFHFDIQRNGFVFIQLHGDEATARARKMVEDMRARAPFKVPIVAAHHCGV